MTDFSTHLAHQVALPLLLCVFACTEPGTAVKPPATNASTFAFDEVSVIAGLDIPLTCGATPGVKSTILEVNGNGIALVDLDNDGDLDIVLVDGNTRAGLIDGTVVPHHVLINQGVSAGVPRFEELFGSGLAMSGWPTGVTTGDIDGDGRVDLVIGGLAQDALFFNRAGADGGLTFEQQPLPGRDSPRDWTTSLALADADGDGLLDLYLARYLYIDPLHPPLNRIADLPCVFAGMNVMCGPHGMPPQADVFLRGLPGPPWFDVATAAAGLADRPPSFGLGVLFADLDQDGHPDLYIANDSVDNFVLRNRGDGSFEALGSLSGASSDMAGRAQAGMGVNTGDIDEDGDFDLVVTNFSNEANALYRNDGDWLFREVSTPSGSAMLSKPLLGWGVHLADFDGDGHLDEFFANGHVYPEADQASGELGYAQPLMLLPGRGDGTFGANGFPDDTPLVSRAAARGDLDGDGDLDLVVLTLDGSPRLFLNRHDSPQSYLLVSLRDLPPHAPDAIGATVTLTTHSGQQVRQKLSARGFQTSDDPRLHFSGGASIVSATVLWPGGVRETLNVSTLGFGQHVLIERGRGVVSQGPLSSSR
ncbi:MAG: hypothetical protein ACI9EF_003781 [Pseudohongiellaceae bacterium]|jgi:hypothetical protein